VFLLLLSSSIARLFNSSSVIPSVFTPSGRGKALTFSTAGARFFFAAGADFFPFDDEAVEVEGEGACSSTSWSKMAEGGAAGREDESKAEGEVKKVEGRAAEASWKLGRARAGSTRLPLKSSGLVVARRALKSTVEISCSLLLSWLELLSAFEGREGV